MAGVEVCSICENLWIVLHLESVLHFMRIYLDSRKCS